MNLTLWIGTGLLALAYLVGNVGTVILPKEKMAAIPGGQGNDFSAGTIKAIDALEVLATVGPVLPVALVITPVLVPLVAAGLVVLMGGAVITCFRRGEAKFVVANLASLERWTASPRLPPVKS